MRKIAIAFAALAAFGIAMPLTSSAKAEDTVIIKKDGDHDRDMHRHHKKIVIIKHHRRHDQTTITITTK